MPKLNNTEFPNTLLKLFISFVLVGFLLFSAAIFYFSNINFWWNKVESLTHKTLGSELVCRKKTWSSFGVLNLESCITPNDSLNFLSLQYKVFEGYVSIKELSIVQMKGSKKKSLSMPKIPFLIQKIEIENLKMNKLKGNVLLSHINTINSIILKRKTLFSDDWTIQSNINEKNLLLKGTLGKRLDLTAIFKEFPFELKELRTKLNGKLFLGTASLGDKQLEIVFNDFSFKDNLIKNTKVDNITIDGLVFLTQNLKNIKGFSNFKFKSQFVNLISDDQNKNRLLISQTKIRNLQKLINSFSKNIKLLNIQDGTVEGYIDFEEKNINQSNVFLKVNELKGLKIKSNSKNIAIPDSNSSILFKPLEPRGENNFYEKYNIEKIDFITINPYRLSNLNQFIKEIQITDGLLDGEFSYNYKDINYRQGKFKINNLQLANEKSGIQINSGNGNIQIDNKDININIKAFNNSSEQLEEIIINGHLTGETKLNGIIEINVPKFTYRKNHSPETFKRLETTISDLGIKAIIKNNKPTSYSSKGVFSQCLCEFIDDKNKIQIHGGSFTANYPGSLNIHDLHISSGASNSIISGNFRIDNRFKATPYTINMYGKSDINDLESLVGIFSNQLKENQLDFSGHMDYQISYIHPSFKQFDVKLNNFSADYQNKSFIKNLNGAFEINGKDLVLNNIYSTFGDKSQFKLFAKLNNFTELIKPNKKIEIEKLIEKSEIRIRALVNPYNLVNTLKEKNLLDDSFSTEIDRSIYLPIFIKAYPKTDLIGFDFATNFQKIQVSNSKIHLSQDLSKLEQIYGTGDYNFKSKKLRINEVNYRGNSFGILANMEAQKDLVSFNIESAPLIDLSELSKIWFNENASGQFKGKIANKGFNPQVENSWLNNLEVSFRSEENVHDIQYGILYGKHFDFNLKTEDGNGKVTLKTKKGKLKNLQLTDLVSEAKIIDGSILEMTNTSFKAADGEVALQGKIDLRNWDSKFTGSMEEVNIETMSNNLFSNAGDYNGKGTLTYDFGGNFLDLLTSKPPKKATGDFIIESGFLNQTEELSKNLHLANLVFGGPLNFRLNTLNNYLNPTGEGNFKYINGKWRFDDKGSNVIHFEEANYIGENALHLKIIGDWDYKKKYLDFDVYGFLPKKPMTISDRQADVERFKEEEKDRLLRDLLLRSRHFKFQVQGSPTKPNQITNSVKSSIQFVDSSSRSEVSKNFLDKDNK